MQEPLLITLLLASRGQTRDHRYLNKRGGCHLWGRLISSWQAGHEEEKAPQPAICKGRKYVIPSAGRWAISAPRGLCLMSCQKAGMKLCLKTCASCRDRVGACKWPSPSWWMFRASYQSENCHRMKAIISKLMAFESYKFFSLFSIFDLNGL